MDRLTEVLASALEGRRPRPADRELIRECARIQAAHDDMLAVLAPLSAWAEMERRKHRAAGEDNEAGYMGLLADAAHAAIAKARGE